MDKRKLARGFIRERARERVLQELAECVSLSAAYSDDALPQRLERSEMPTEPTEELILREATWRAGYRMAFGTEPGPWSHLGGWFNQELAWIADNHLPVYGYEWPWHPQFLPEGYDATSAVLKIKRAQGDTDQEKYFPDKRALERASARLARLQGGVWGAFKHWLVAVVILAVLGVAIALLTN